jgi:hypothetical protein
LYQLLLIKNNVFFIIKAFYQLGAPKVTVGLEPRLVSIQSLSFLMVLFFTLSTVPPTVKVVLGGGQKVNISSPFPVANETCLVVFTSFEN